MAEIADGENYLCLSGRVHNDRASETPLFYLCRSQLINYASSVQGRQRFLLVPRRTSRGSFDSNPHFNENNQGCENQGRENQGREIILLCNHKEGGVVDGDDVVPLSLDHVALPSTTPPYRRGICCSLRPIQALFLGDCLQAGICRPFDRHTKFSAIIAHCVMFCDMTYWARSKTNKAMLELKETDMYSGQEKQKHTNSTKYLAISG